MILVDTSVWIDHLRNPEGALAKLVRQKQILCHPFVVGEMALGRYLQRELIIKDLSRLPRAKVARNDEVLHLIDSRSMHGAGIGYVDAHLLTSVKLGADMQLWTRDLRLYKVAHRLHVAYTEPTTI